VTCAIAGLGDAELPAMWSHTSWFADTSHRSLKQQY